MADIEIQICTFCGAIINDSNIVSNVWYCPSCGQPQSGQPQNASTDVTEG